MNISKSDTPENGKTSITSERAKSTIFNTKYGSLSFLPTYTPYLIVKLLHNLRSDQFHFSIKQKLSYHSDEFL